MMINGQGTVTHSDRVSEKTVSDHFGGGMPSTSIPSLYMTPSGPVYLPTPPPPPHMTPHMMPPYNVMIPNTHPDHHVGNSETTVGAEGQSMMINFMCQINQRMTEIQGSVSKLNDIQKDMNQIHIHFNKIQKENYDMRAKMNTIETFAETVGTVCDDFLNTKQTVTDEVSELKKENSRLKSELDIAKTEMGDMKKGHDDLYENFLELKTRTMQNNLIFFGIHEIERDGNTEGLLRDVIANELTLPAGQHAEDLSFNVVHRLGRRKAPNQYSGETRPRPIVAQFEKFKEREKVRNAATTINDSRLSIREHFPHEIEERRKQLYPVMRKALKGDNKIRMVRDKLYINDVLYDKTDKKFERFRPQLNTNENLRNPWSRQNVRSNYNDIPSYRKSGQNIQYDSSESTPRAYDIDSRKFVRAGRVRLNPTSASNIDFSTPNPYQGLARAGNEETQSVVRNKQKLTSPYDDRENKKLREGAFSEQVQEIETNDSNDQNSKDDNKQAENTIVQNEQAENTNIQNDSDINQKSEMTVNVEIHRENEPYETGTDDKMDVAPGDEDKQVDVD